MSALASLKRNWVWAGLLLLCVLMLRVLLSIAFALSGIPGRMHDAQVLDW